MQDFFGQLWKEYALSDSRYLTSDPLVLCMESLTVVRMTSLPCRISTADGTVAYLGPAVSVDSCADYKRITLSPSCASVGVHRTILWEPHILFDLLI